MCHLGCYEGALSLLYLINLTHNPKQGMESLGRSTISKTLGFTENANYNNYDVFKLIINS
jgi:hypothetical protein